LVYKLLSNQIIFCPASHPLLCRNDVNDRFPAGMNLVEKAYSLGNLIERVASVNDRLYL
jgi:hypothetical protein